MTDTKTDGPWLHAWYDPVAGLKAFSQVMRMADLGNENDFRLLVADQDNKLKVYRGTGVSSVHALVDTPVALCVFYPEGALPRVPSVAVAAGPYVYVYRNLRPYLKFSLPPLPLHPAEGAGWDALYAGSASIPDTVRCFSALREGDARLSSRALDLLVLPQGKERQELVEATRGKPLSQQTVVTCMETLCTEREGVGEASTLVLGTEGRALLFLDASGSGVEGSVDLPAVPVQIVIHGTKKGEHRINVLCRDGGVYAVRDKALLPTRLYAGSMPVAIARSEGEVVLATMDNRVTAFDPKGKKTWSAALPALPTAICRMYVKRDRVCDCVAVACEGGLIRVFNGRSVVAEHQAPETVVAMRYGQYQREANTLVYATRSGALAIKMLKRTASLDPPTAVGAGGGGGGPGGGLDAAPLPVPKKTRLYLEQAQREREAPADMHRLFQRDLVKLRLNVARSYVKSLKDGGAALLSGGGGGGGDAGGGVRLTAAVQGLGPRFRLRLELHNGGSSPLSDVLVLVLFNPSVYSCATPCTTLPLLLPGFPCVLHVPLLCVDEGGGADLVRVHVVKAGARAPLGEDGRGDKSAPASPLITATINMPLSQPPQQVG